MQPKCKRRKSKKDDIGKKSKKTDDDKKQKKSEDNTGKIKAAESSVGKNTTGELYPAKQTGSSGPVTWDCPFCEDKKYEDNLEYLVHLQKDHKLNLPGNAVKKIVPKGKPEKVSKGKGKR